MPIQNTSWCYRRTSSRRSAGCSAYPRLRSLSQLTDIKIQQHVQLLRSVCRLVEPASGPCIVQSDPNDDPVLYTAVAADADVLCTKDLDFYEPDVLAFCTRQDIRVMDDLELLTLL